MAEKEQVKPLAPAAYPISVDDDGAISMELKKHRNRKYVKCCGCITALILIQVVVILILVFTVLRVKDPVIKMNSVNFEGFDVLNEAARLSAANVTLTANLSVKNPNIASFKFSNATTIIYYHDVEVGDARNPPGVAKARRTLPMNLTVNIMLEKLLGVPSFFSDLSSTELNMSSYTRIGGRVKILKIIKKHVVVKLNCTMTVNIGSQSIPYQHCRRSVSL